MTKIKLFLGSYLAIVLSLFFYSFTQVDLSLTLSKASFLQEIQKQFQYIGFFQRPFSASIFVVIIGLLFFYYLSILYLAKKEKINLSLLKIMVPLVFIILVFSYNAFSYDLFNYIFDAKILTVYGQNPYLHAPKDFIGDPMLNFMRWTHRFYPYGPSWLLLTVPLSFVGSKIFVLTFFLFKVLIGATFLGSVYLIYKISDLLFPKDKIFNTVMFAFNPLVLIEALVSAHNDFPLIFFALLAIYLFVKKQRALSYLSLLFSIGVKYSTIVLAPIFLYMEFLQFKKRKIDYEKIFLLSVAFSVVAIVLASLRTTFQPWYLMLPFALGALVSKKLYVFLSIIISSITCLFVYFAYVLLTDYSKGYTEIVNSIEITGLCILVLSLGLSFAIPRLIARD
jgi:hypothetical protein